MKKFIIRSFVAAIILINGWCALPTMYKAPYRGVGSDVVSVYDNSDFRPLVAVTRIDGEEFLDTGKKVAVSILSDYQNQGREQLAGINLIALFVAIGFYRWQERGKKKVSETINSQVA